MPLSFNNNSLQKDRKVDRGKHNKEPIQVLNKQRNQGSDPLPRTNNSKPIYTTFVDLEKAFNNERWAELFHTIEQISLVFKDKRIMLKLYVMKGL